MVETKFKICKNNPQYTPVILSSNNVSQLEFYHPNTVSWNSPLMQFESIYGRQKRQDIFDLMASIIYNSPKGKVRGSYLILHGTLLMRYYDNGYRVKPIAIVCINPYGSKVVVINSDYINSHPSELKDIKHAAFLLGVPPRTSRAIIMKSQVEMIMMFQEKLSFNLEDLEPERQLILSKEFLQSKKNPVVIEKPKKVVAEVPKTSIPARKNPHIKREDWAQFFKDEDEELSEEEVDEIREQVDTAVADYNEANRRRVEEARERIDNIVSTIRNNIALDQGTISVGTSTSSSISSTTSSNNSTLSAEEEERINREFEELLNS